MAAAPFCPRAAAEEAARDGVSIEAADGAEPDPADSYEV